MRNINEVNTRRREIQQEIDLKLWKRKWNNADVEINKATKKEISYTLTVAKQRYVRIVKIEESDSIESIAEAVMVDAMAPGYSLRISKS